jgi:hypothetical protein
MRRNRVVWLLVLAAVMLVLAGGWLRYAAVSALVTSPRHWKVTLPATRGTPHVMCMHIGGHGDAVKLADAVPRVIALTKTPAPAQSPSAPPALEMDTAAIDQILGHKGKVNGGVYQVGVPRAEKITDGGMAVPGAMGLATALNFQPTGAGKAAITGDFVLLGSEVNPVIKALRQNGIQVTAVHSHMLQEEPRLFFMHFWANDDAVKLAKGLRAALDNTNSAK